MITRNDYHHQLFNGDIGIILPDPEDPTRRRAWFINESGELRSILPSRLPECKTVYAMTIHKSQGSEFEHVAVVLPDYDFPLLSRELLYTATTRARHGISLFAGKEILQATIFRKVERRSGLVDALWGSEG
jgi:exodeoxyribonuclease V alpha subunit